MMNKLIVVFGLPGAGKSYVADILGQQFGYFVYDGDTDIPSDMRDALNRKDSITDTMREEFLNNMIDSVKHLSQSHTKLVIHQTFLKEFMRKRFIQAFPNAQFMLIKSPDDIREARYMKRAYFNLGITYLRHMTDLFEPIGTPHKIIQNNEEGAGHIIKQLRKIIRD